VIIPIGHDHGVTRYPWATITLIALCTVVQIYSTAAAPSRREIAEAIAQVEAAQTDEEAQAVMAHTKALLDRVPIWRFGYRTGEGMDYRILTSAFVHDGWIHLIGNMLFLWLVGSALEDRWGRAKFVAFYLLGAVVATTCYELTYTGPQTILVGASGAVSAAMGAFLVYFARTRITLWYFMMMRSGTFQIPAYVALPLWLGDQALLATLDKGSGGATQVAYAAHFGGFGFGLAIAIVAIMVWPRSALPRSDDDEEVVAAEPVKDDRYLQCNAAIKKGEIGTVRTLASRVMIDLVRGKDHARALQLFRTIDDARFPSIPLTDGAFLAAADAAAVMRDDLAFVEILDAMRVEHPGSVQLPKALWRLAVHHGRAGREAEETELLTLLAERYGRHEFGAKAAKELAKRAV
jgi:membrane associated rhomboid family serine protease